MESMPKASEFKWKDMEAEAEAATTAALERCTTPPAQSGKTCQVPFKPDGSRPYIAATATRSISQPDHPEDTELGNHPFGIAI